MDNERLHEIVTAVAKHLPEWSVAPTSVDRSWFRYLQHEGDSAQIHVELSKGTRLVCSGSIERHGANGKLVGLPLELERVPRITCGANLDPKMIARQLQNRLIPAFLEHRAKVVQYIADIDARNQRQQRLIDNLVDLSGGRRSSWETDRFYADFERKGVSISADVRVNHDATGEMKLHAPVAVLRLALKVLRRKYGGPS